MYVLLHLHIVHPSSKPPQIERVVFSCKIEHFHHQYKSTMENDLKVNLRCGELGLMGTFGSMN